MSSRKLQVGIAVGAAIVVMVLFFIVGNPFAVIGTNNAATSAVPTTKPGQLIAQDEVVGSGAQANTGDKVTVNYTGKLQNGQIFDTSIGKAPFSFTLGGGNVIQGWDLGLTGMKVGGKRLLIIPSDMAYGASGYGPIPPNADLVFEVELLSVTPGQ